MERQRNNLQTKAKKESLEMELNGIEARKLSDIVLNIIVIRVLKELSELQGTTGCSRNYISIRKDINYELEPVGNEECNI